MGESAQLCCISYINFKIINHALKKFEMNKQLKFSPLISNMVNIDNYSSYEQKLLGVLNFQEHKGGLILRSQRTISLRNGGQIHHMNKILKFYCFVYLFGIWTTYLQFLFLVVMICHWMEFCVIVQVGRRFLCVFLKKIFIFI